MKLTDVLQLAWALLVIGAAIALIVAFPWILILLLCGSPLFLGRRGA